MAAAARRFTTSIQPRMADLNVGGHVDNCTALRILDEARIRWFGYRGPAGSGYLGGLLRLVEEPVTWVVASQHAEYHQELFYDPVEAFRVTLWIGAIGRSSFTVQSTLAATGPDQAPAAVVAETVIVMRDQRTAGPWPITGGFRDALSGHLGPRVPLRRGEG